MITAGRHQHPMRANAAPTSAGVEGTIDLSQASFPQIDPGIAAAPVDPLSLAADVAVLTIVVGIFAAQFKKMIKWIYS